MFTSPASSHSSSGINGCSAVFGQRNWNGDSFGPKTLSSEAVFGSPAASSGMSNNGGHSTWAFGQTSSRPFSSTSTFGGPSYAAGFGRSTSGFLGYSNVFCSPTEMPNSHGASTWTTFNQTSSSLSTPTTTSFGAPSPYGFGSATSGGPHARRLTFDVKESGIVGEEKGSKIEKYKRSPIPETKYSAGKIVSISAMPVYKGKSHDELRWEDYNLTNKQQGGYAAVKSTTTSSSRSLSPFRSSSPVTRNSWGTTSVSTTPPMKPNHPFGKSVGTSTPRWNFPGPLTSPASASPSNHNPFSWGVGPPPPATSPSSSLNAFWSTPFTSNSVTAPLAANSCMLGGSTFNQPKSQKYNGEITTPKSHFSFESTSCKSLSSSAANTCLTTVNVSAAPLEDSQNPLIINPFTTNMSSSGFSTPTPTFAPFTSRPSFLSGFWPTPVATAPLAANSVSGSTFNQPTTTLPSSTHKYNGEITNGVVGQISSIIDQPSSSAAATPFGILPHLSFQSIQYGISSMPVKDKPTAPVRHPLLTTRHLYRRSKLPIRKYDPAKLNASKVPYFFSIPKENPRELVITRNIHEKNKSDDIYYENDKDDIKPCACSSDGTEDNKVPLKLLQLPDDYYTKPQISELEAKEREEPGCLSRVKDFVIGRHGYGSIKFLGDTDVRSNLDFEAHDVQFNKREVIVYMDESKKPPVGQGLNKPAEITLLNIKCIDKSKVDKVREMLKKRVAAQGGEFVSYDPVEGEWKFRVQHF